METKNFISKNNVGNLEINEQTSGNLTSGASNFNGEETSYNVGVENLEYTGDYNEWFVMLKIPHSKIVYAGSDTDDCSCEISIDGKGDWERYSLAGALMRLALILNPDCVIEEVKNNKIV